MQRLPGLDTLRAAAIVWVMLFHSWVVGGLGPHFDWLSRYGWVGVDIFFVLSGFLIGSQVLAPLARGERLDLIDFYRRRAYRILPAFAVALALYVFVPALREFDGLAPWWQFATFTLNLLIDYRAQPAFSHAWSLCVEEHFYLLFPLLAMALARQRSGKALAGVALLLVLGGIALRTALWLHDTALDPPRNWYIEDLYFPTWARLDGLLAGVLLAALKAFRPMLWTRAQAHATVTMWAGLAVIALAFVLFRDRVALLPNAIGWPLLSAGIGLLVLAAAGPVSALGRVRVPGAAWIAGISYSLYLSHKIAFHLVQVALGDRLHGVAIFAVYALAALALGSALHMWVERPFLRLRERRAMRRALPVAA
ncbi:acyltransferase [Dyella ginsengisoli]|uniref:Acyltransferase n=1 Tax=Dyella ginsengisoli TaxID=363848 RepID=A0ABW8JTR5_9GAMM